MKEEEIYKIAAELLEKIDLAQSTANEIVNTYTKKHKYIEAQDRKLLLDLIWSCIRAKARLSYKYPDTDWLFKLERLKEEGVPDSSNMPLAVALEVQEWFLDHIPDAENDPGAAHGISYLVDTPRYHKIVKNFVQTVLE